MGLFPCILINRARSVLLSVVLGVCVSVNAGSKIEFSVPDTDIEVPDWQKELKKDEKNSLKNEIELKGNGPNVLPPMVAPIVVSRPQDRDAFATEKSKENEKNGKMARAEQSSANKGLASEEYKAARAAEEMRNGSSDETISSSSWQVSRRSETGHDSDRDSSRGGGYNSHERSIGWSTLFKESQEERDRKEQASRLNDFRALYDTANSMAPIGTPSPNSDPVKQSLWNDQRANAQGSRVDFMTRPDYSQNSQSLFVPRNNEDSFNSGPVRNDFRQSEIAPVREFEQHRGVLDMPKRPGDVLR